MRVFLLLLLMLANHTALARTQDHCFSGRMRILTPKGYVRLNTLKSGDAVISWNVRAQEPVVNLVVSATLISNVEFGELCRVLDRSGRPLEVTEGQPFYAPESARYQRLDHIDESDSLLRIDGCETALIPRGPYRRHAGRTYAVRLRLYDSPHNFIIEGVLVQP